MGDFNGHVGRRIDVLRVCMMGTELAKKLLIEEDYWSFVMKRGCVWQIHGLQRRSREK